MKWQALVALEVVEWVVFMAVMPVFVKVYRWLDRQG